MWQLENGACLVEGGVHFQVWAPNAKSVAVKIEDKIVPMTGGATYSVTVPDLSAGVDYTYLLDGERERADPVSRSQPHGFNGPSRVVDPRFPWSDREWTVPPLDDMIFYELHVGAFTEEGSFEAVIAKLPHLKALGVNTLSIMPVAEFPGERNWGYDGVFPYAPSSVYGGPEGFKKLIDACHSQGFAVVLDVVYNHLGPEGNYLHEFGPYFTDRYKTPWGWAINYDGPDSDHVRQYVIDNARYWLTEYHIDGLRLDAVHAIFDFSAHHILKELKTACAGMGLIIVESDLNDVRLLQPHNQGGYNIDAQWHDDFHHAIHAAVTGRRDEYLVDFGTPGDVAKAFTDGYVVDGRYSTYRRRHFGSSTKDRPASQFISFNQNHDQIANICRGQRLAALASADHQKVAAMLLLCSPTLPLLFMGEELGATNPFHFFTSFLDPTLAEAVRQGRLSEVGHGAHDPQDLATFLASKIDWTQTDPSTLDLYKQLIHLRKTHPSLSNRDKTRTHLTHTTDTLTLTRAPGAHLLVNLSDHPQTIDLPNPYPLALATHPSITSNHLPPMSAALFLDT